MNERHLKLGQLTELQRELERSENLAIGVLSQLRMDAFPAPMGSPFDLDDQKIVDQAEHFQQLCIEGRRKRQAITKLREELGE